MPFLPRDAIAKRGIFSLLTDLAYFSPPFCQFATPSHYISYLKRISQ